MKTLLLLTAVLISGIAANALSTWSETKTTPRERTEQAHERARNYPAYTVDAIGLRKRNVQSKTVQPLAKPEPKAPEPKSENPLEEWLKYPGNRAMFEYRLRQRMQIPWRDCVPSELRCIDGDYVT